ncbi:hypothetical protein D3C81_1237960 [compost metagenome]
MILDKLNTFSDAQAVTATAASTNVIDLGPLTHGNTVRDIGAGEPVYLFVSVGAAATAGGAATVTIALQTDTVENFATPTNLFVSATFALADMGAGAQLVGIAVPRGVERYLRLNYTVATGPLLTGTFYAGLVKDLQDIPGVQQYASGFVIDPV